MKKNTVKLFILAAMLGGSLSTYAQAKSSRVAMKDADVKRLTELGNEFKRTYDINHAEALRLAEINNWPLIIKGENGAISTLTKVDAKGQPIYTGTSNVGSAITSRTNHLQPGGSLNLNLTGAFGEDEDPMFVGVWDGGYPRATHHDLQGRLIQQSPGNLPEALHPTHVTGTIIGSGVSAANAKGMAPGATALTSDYDADEAEITFFAASGYILSSHSYGYDPSQLGTQLEDYRGSYIDESKAVDQVTFDAPYYLPVYAAGNAGNGISYDLLTDRGTAKNNIVVAAVYEVDDYQTAESVEITNFSSFGPTNDNRIKPDISNKGYHVYSCSDDSDTAHVEEDGTSMATPGITGSLVLLQQYYSILHPSSTANRNFMRSATVRALVAHSADEAGLADGPDPVYGWGLMNAKRAAEIIKADNTTGTSEIHELILTPGQTYTYTVAASGTEPLVATIAWTDPAPTGNIALGANTSVLVNNLDLKVTQGTSTYYPWRLDSSGQFAENVGANDKDNIEKVEIPGATAGNYTITVTHKKTTLKNPNGDPEQAYSLIVSGLTGELVGLDEVNNKMFSVWPNPANNILNISFADGVEKDASAVFYDVQGRLVRTAQLTGVDNTIDVQGFAKGLYIVSVTNGGKIQNEKVVIK